MTKFTLFSAVFFAAACIFAFVVGRPLIGIMNLVLVALYILTARSSKHNASE